MMHQNINMKLVASDISSKKGRERAIEVGKKINMIKIIERARKNIAQNKKKQRTGTTDDL
jgi:hypothetical protein